MDYGHGCVYRKRFAQLFNLNDPSEVAGGHQVRRQLTSFPRSSLVDFQTALTAATRYFATAQADPALSWEWYSVRASSRCARSQR